ncbi:four helix bundle protein [Oceanithermus sp.]|uniref:four helix bundle protein n=1 Tax=Oceanithermus sp. TaxID=2268145 RepID=UPI002580956D|nr:four helix bundle protein [Oceanithermus sp.]
MGTPSKNQGNDHAAGLSVGNLEIWSEAMDIVETAYTLTQAWPEAEKYGLTSQTRRAVVSIPANLAEGAGRGTRKEKSRYGRIALGSLYELDTLLQIAVRLGFANPDETVGLRGDLARLAKRLNAYIRHQEEQT